MIKKFINFLNKNYLSKINKNFMDNEIDRIERNLKKKKNFYYFLDENTHGFSIGTYLYTLFFLRYFVIQGKFVNIIYIEGLHPKYKKLNEKDLKYYRKNFKYFAKIILKKNFSIKKIKKFQKESFYRNLINEHILMKQKLIKNETLHNYIAYMLNKMLLKKKKLLKKYFITIKKNDLRNVSKKVNLNKRFVTVSLRYDINFPKNRNINSHFLNKLIFFLIKKFKNHKIIILSDIGGTRMMKKMISQDLSKKVIFSKDLSNHISVDLFLLFNSVNNIGTTFTGGLFESLLFTQKPFFHHGRYSISHNKVFSENHSFDKRKRFFWNTKKQIWIPTINHCDPEDIFIKIDKFLTI